MTVWRRDNDDHQDSISLAGCCNLVEAASMSESSNNLHIMIRDVEKTSSELAMVVVDTVTLKMIKH